MPAIDSTIILICDICPSNWVTRNPWAWISGVRDPVPLSTVGWGSSGPSGDRDRSRTSSTIAQTTGREPVGSATINKSETLIGPGLLFSNFSKSKRAWQYRLIFQLFPLTYAWATSLWRSLNDFGPVQLKFAKNEIISLLTSKTRSPNWDSTTVQILGCHAMSLNFISGKFSTRKGHTKTTPFREMKFLRIFWSKQNKLHVSDSSPVKHS